MLFTASVTDSIVEGNHATGSFSDGRSGTTSGISGIFSFPLAGGSASGGGLYCHAFD